MQKIIDIGYNPNTNFNIVVVRSLTVLTIKTNKLKRDKTILKANNIAKVKLKILVFVSYGRELSKPI